MNPRKSFRMAAVVALLASASAAKAEPTLLVIGVDLSASNPLVTNATYRQQALRRVNEKIQALEVGSQVILRAFGNNPISQPPIPIPDSDILVWNHRARDGAADSRTAVLNAASLTFLRQINGLLQTPGQQYTRIARFLDELQSDIGRHVAFNPGDGVRYRSVDFILLTDGVEDNGTVNLRLDGAELPMPGRMFPPPGRQQPRCSGFTMFGAGQATQVLPDAVSAHIRGEWRAWATAAGCASYDE